MTTDGAGFYLKYGSVLTTSGRIYYRYYWDIVLSVFVLTLCVVIYLILVNIASRRNLKRNTPSIVWKGYSRCLCYLCLLHITSWILIVALLLKHVRAFWSKWSCKLGNELFVIAFHCSQALIWQIYKSRLAAMSKVLYQHRLVLTATNLLTTVLVLVPFGSLALILLKMKTTWDSGECRLYIAKSYGILSMYINIGICLVFFVLFLQQMCKAYRTIKHSQAERGIQTGNALQSAKHTALRNVAVIILTLFWLVIYDGPCNYGSFGNNDSNAVEQFEIYTGRLLVGLNYLTTNVILYFIFRTWCYFLCYPCYNLDKASIPLKSTMIPRKSTSTLE